MMLVRGVLILVICLLAVDAQARRLPFWPQPHYLPPASQSTIAPLGDSRTAIIAYDLTDVQKATQNHHNWANALNKQFIPYTGNWGVSGETTGQVLKRLLPALKTRPKFLVILGGVNDPGHGIPTNTTWQDLRTMAQAAIDRGVRPVLFTDQGAENMTTPQATAFHGAGGLNDMIRAWAAATAKRGTVLVDWVPTLLSSTIPVLYNTGYSYDGVHLDVPGGYYGGQYFASVMAPLVPAGTDPSLAGTLLSNGDFATATGGGVGTGNNGTMPASWTAQRDGTTVTAFSLNTRGDGVKEIVAALTCPADSSPRGYNIRQAIVGLSPGDVVQAGVQVDVDTGYSNLADVRVEIDLNYTDSTFLIGYDNELSTSKLSIPSIGGGLTLTMMTNPMTVDPAKTLSSVNFRMASRCNNGSGGSMTARLRNPWAKKL